MRAATFSRSLVTLAAALSTMGLGLAQPAAVVEKPARAERIRTVEVPEVRLPTDAEGLQERIPEASFDEAPLDNVLDWLDSLTTTNLVIRWRLLENAGVGRDTPITMSLRNLRFYQVLWTVLDEAGGRDAKLAWEIFDEGLVVVSTAEDLERELILRIYDVRPLLAGNMAWRNRQAELKAHQAPAGREPEQVRSAAQPAGTAAAEQTAPEQLAPGAEHSAGGAAYAWEYVYPPEQELCEVLLYSVRPDSWLENGGLGTAQCFNGMLVVRQSRSVHRELAALLNALLEAGAVETEPH
jgi:hypothetical protein